MQRLTLTFYKREFPHRQHRPVSRSRTGRAVSVRDRINLKNFERHFSPKSMARMNFMESSNAETRVMHTNHCPTDCRSVERKSGVILPENAGDRIVFRFLNRPHNWSELRFVIETLVCSWDSSSG